MTKILFTGGGTGGHIFPLIAIAQEMKKKATDTNFFLSYMGPEDFTSENFLKKEEISAHYISSGKIRRYFHLDHFLQISETCFLEFPLESFRLL
jgi:UDP-N-acetylglucosamine--N-acetylmuramyl-(pentapeptide) pyrophosphoryl-undecaprenol N-acetylglucosamine transferase